MFRRLLTIVVLGLAVSACVPYNSGYSVYRSDVYTVPAPYYYGVYRPYYVYPHPYYAPSPHYWGPGPGYHYGYGGGYGRGWGGRENTAHVTRLIPASQAGVRIVSLRCGY